MKTQEVRKQQLIDAVKELVAAEGKTSKPLIRVMVYPSSLVTYAVTALYKTYNEYDESTRVRKSFWAYFGNGDGPDFVETKFDKWPPKIKIRVPQTSSKTLDEWAEWLEKRKENGRLHRRS